MLRVAEKFIEFIEQHQTGGGRGQGATKPKIRRFLKTRRGRLYPAPGKPGDTIKMSDRTYHVAADGSFRRVVEV